MATFQVYYLRILVAIFLFILILVHIFKRYKKQREEYVYSVKNGCQPARSWNSRWPLGLDMILRARHHGKDHSALRFLLQLFDESGTTFEQTLLGARSLNTIDPDNIQTILSGSFEDWNLGFREPSFHPLLGSGIFTQDGATWKQSRHLLRPHFALTRARTFERIQLCVDRLLASIPRDGSVVDLKPLFLHLTFQTTMFLLFGEDSNNIDTPQSDFASAFQTAQDYLPPRVRLGKFYWAVDDKSFRSACRTCHEFIDQGVDRALQKLASGKITGEDECPSFVESLMGRTQDRRILRDQCLNMLLAGRDTTACCLSWTLRLLSRNQSALGRLRQEVEEVCGLGPDAERPSREAVKHMKYLHYVIKESLRLYPSVPVNSRTATRTTTLPAGGGPDGRAPVLVRQGEAVRYSVYAMHRRRDIYGDDADEFRPGRWEHGGLRDVGWGYLPFNGGPRLCLGQEFALLEIAYTVCRLIQVLPKIGPAGDDAGITLGMEKQELSLVLSALDGCCVSLDANPYAENAVYMP